MLEASLRIVVPPTKCTEIQDVLHRLKGPTEVAHGCRGCRLLRDEENEYALTYCVRWETRDGLEAHLRSDRFRTLLPYIEMSSEPPQIEVAAIEVIGGIEFLVRVLAADPE